MRRRTGYDYISEEGGHTYRFTSIGPKGEIQKIVSVSPAVGNAWYFAFGDAIGDGDDFDDEVISNNGDMRKVLQTLANIIYDFLAENPDFKVVAHPVDGKRKTLYNWVIQRNFELISAELEIVGVLNNTAEPILRTPKKQYDLFVFSLKSFNFERNFDL